MRVAVIDIGKTNAKVALVDLASATEIAVETRPNGVLADGPYPHYDVDGLWDFILDGLARIAAKHAVDAISVTTHGATAALLDASGALALPVLDYEHTGPDELAEAYDAARPAFDETGSPRLPIGLNLGAQVFWQQERFPKQFARVASIAMYAQYWSFRLTGVLAGEVTSLGCHTDLWNPAKADYSSLVDGQGWRKLMPPVRPARDRLGAILPDIAARTGLKPETPVHCGIHDSNASLLPHLLARKPPFAVVSTGTWVVSMAVGAKPVRLDPARDMLVNVNALGDPVPSARFMGGREFATVTAGHSSWTEAEAGRVIGQEILLLPSVQPGSGPFPNKAMRWIGADGITPGERAAATSLYLGLMTATCLELMGADGPVIVEGPFAANRLYLDMLRAATGRPVQTAASKSTGTSIGAALLAAPVTQPVADEIDDDAPVSEALAKYAARWRRETV